jgi:hypothetical protein
MPLKVSHRITTSVTDAGSGPRFAFGGGAHQNLKNNYVAEALPSA